MIYNYCTYFDQNYLSRGLALYRSLRDYCPEFNLWVLCMDQAACETLKGLGLPGIHPISLEEFEQNDNLLLKAKQNRSRVEYYFTCTPSLVLFILNRYPHVDLITYLDADLFFFADPYPLFVEMDGKSIGIIGHRFPARLRYREKYGIYNVGWLSFRRDETGLECLHLWRKLCLEWCYDRVESDRFADQKYLDRFPERYGQTIILQHKGANVAPWNIDNYSLTANGNTVYVDNQPLLFFHFQGFKQVLPWVYDWGLGTYGVKMSPELMEYIYTPYLHALQEPLLGKLALKTIRNSKGGENISARIRKIINWCVMFFRGALKREFSLIIKGKVIPF